MEPAQGHFVLAALIVAMAVSIPGPTQLKAQAFTSTFPSANLVAPHNAIYAYGYGSPTSAIPADLLHVVQFHAGGGIWLNLWPFFYPETTKVWVIGRDQPGIFFLCVVDPTGQTMWFPRTELEGITDDSLMALSVVWQTNAPPYPAESTRLP